MCNQVRYKNGEVSWQLNTFPNHSDETGELGVIEFGQQFNFIVKRVFFLRNLIPNSQRGFHSHKDLNQILVCLNGSFNILLDNGAEKKIIHMKANDQCLYLDGKVWREMSSFAENTVIMVLCDREYKFDEVIRNYEIFHENISGI